VSVRTFLLVTQLVVVCTEPAATVTTGIGLLPSMDAHMSVPCGSVVQSFATDGTFLPLLRVAHTRGLQLLHVVVQLHLCIDIGHGSCWVTEVESLTGSGFRARS